MKSKRAFTLIELLLVTGTISLLMSVVFFKVTEAKKKAEDAHMVAETSQVTRAVSMYKNDNGGRVSGHQMNTGSRPLTLTERNPDGTINEDYVSALQPLVTSGYLPSIPYSPTGDDYAYLIGVGGYDAVFAANLNYVRSDSDRTNSCSIASSPQESEISFTESSYCEFASVTSESCTSGELNTETQACIEVTDSTIASNCGCYGGNPGSSNSSFPESICRYFIMGSGGGSCQTISTGAGAIPFMCDGYSTTENTDPQICGGSSSTDYCSCL